MNICVTISVRELKEALSPNLKNFSWGRAKRRCANDEATDARLDLIPYLSRASVVVVDISQPQSKFMTDRV